MDRLLREYKDYCRAFIDDVVIFSDNLKDHIQHLRIIFTLFRSKNIAILPTKSYVAYLLRFHVDGLGLTNPASRIKAFHDLAFPGNLKALEQYIGATSFFHHLIPYCATISEPLQQRKTNFLAHRRRTSIGGWQ